MKVLLAKTYSDEDPTGYYISSKLDGVRNYYDGKQLYSRNGNRFDAPEFFIENFPDFPLDGELYLGPRSFNECVGIVKRTRKSRQRNDDDWKRLKYFVFDAPKMNKPFKDRYNFLVSYFQKNPNPYIVVLPHRICQGKDDLFETLDRVAAKGEEGVMLRDPDSFYENKRSNSLLKVKKFLDTDALVLGHSKGTGRISHLMGRLNCILPNGVTFDVGSGFSDVDRGRPPKKGSVITVKYQELTNSGKPRFPVFVRVRKDVNWEDIVGQAKQDETDQIDELVEQEEEPQDRQECRYGRDCYRKNKEHHLRFAHPEKQRVS
jgi:DNA ligase-1